MTNDNRSALRRAIEDGVGLIDVIEKACIRDMVTGCWVWPRLLDRDGYAIARWRKGPKQVEIYLGRKIVEMTTGIYEYEQCHHICANKACCNPDHLARVTASENIGEMMARFALERRIAELEQALRTLAPTHPTLAA